MIVVFDSGIWISALHFGGIPLAALGNGFLNHELAICDQIVIEIKSVLVSYDLGRNILKGQERAILEA